MSALAIALTDEQLRAAHRDLNDPVSFETMQRCPALMICLRNLAELKARRAFRCPAPALPVRTRTAKATARPIVDGKRAAANDRDD